jgi:hypothetical protein
MEWQFPNRAGVPKSWSQRFMSASQAPPADPAREQISKNRLIPQFSNAQENCIALSGFEGQPTCLKTVFTT